MMPSFFNIQECLPCISWRAGYGARGHNQGPFTAWSRAHGSIEGPWHDRGLLYDSNITIKTGLNKFIINLSDMAQNNSTKHLTAWHYNYLLLRQLTRLQVHTLRCPSLGNAIISNSQTDTPQRNQKIFEAGKGSNQRHWSPQTLALIHGPTSLSS